MGSHLGTNVGKSQLIFMAVHSTVDQVESRRQSLDRSDFLVVLYLDHFAAEEAVGVLTS